VSQIAGSPVAIAVTYTVTGNAVSDATYSVQPAAIALESPSNGPLLTSAVNITAYQVPPYGAYVRFTSQTGGPIASMSFKQTSASAEPFAYGTGTLTVELKSPASLGPGIFADVITLSICYDRACTKAAVGSPYSIPVSYTVTASAGQQFQEQVINQSLSALAVDPTGQVLYGTTFPTTNAAGNPVAPQLLSINPLTQAVTPLLTLPAGISQIVASADGAYLYLLTSATINFQLNPAIQVLRVRTVDMTIDQAVPLTTVTTGSAQLAVSPLASSTWSAAFPSQPDVWTVEIFDGIVARPNTWEVTSDVVYGNEAIWSGDATTLYILDANLNAVAVNPTGVGTATLLQSGSAALGGSFDKGGNIQLAGGLLYSASGEVLDPVANAIIGAYVFPSSVSYAELTVDTGNSKVFASYTATVADSAEGTIESYNLSSFEPISIARLPVESQPLRWGSNGLAFIGPGASQGLAALYLISGTFVAP
jgi:hypothetical protein